MNNTNHFGEGRFQCDFCDEGHRYEVKPVKKVNNLPLYIGITILVISGFAAVALLNNL